jgi:hypothetical protein
MSPYVSIQSRAALMFGQICSMNSWSPVVARYSPARAMYSGVESTEP